ncbi:MAG: MFS transporter, partial [Verrucomicrobiaceae bacterium]
VATFTTHLIVSYAASLARPEERGRVVGAVMSGLLIGILLARTFSGVTSTYLGWRTVYVVAATLQLLLVFVLRGLLPADAPRAVIRYSRLLGSMWELWRTVPLLRESCIYGSTTFACFGAFWITLTFHLEAPPFQYSSGIIGLFGVLGVAGAVAASLAGRFSDRKGPRFAIGLGIVTLLFSFVVMGLWGGQVAALIIGVLLLDSGIQAVHISNQTRIYSMMPEARSRLNAVYVVTYFAGGAIGSAAGTWIYTRFGWSGVCMLGASFCVVGLAALAVKRGEVSARYSRDV